MNQKKLNAMSVDALFKLYNEVSSALEKRIKSKIGDLQQIVEVLETAPSLERIDAPRRKPYPKVVPKYQNPARPDETWAGRGRTPHWVTELVQSGKNIEDFRISHHRETEPA
jgi:DNA-binding protein H-NS